MGSASLAGSPLVFLYFFSEFLFTHPYKSHSIIPKTLLGSVNILENAVFIIKDPNLGERYD
jgi:hypothetical protein